MLPSIEYESESRRIKHGKLSVAFRTGLPWQLLLDSMASAAKEEEVALSQKAR